MITHAVIPVAGFGTRMLPLSKSVPKELLPLGDKPAIQYVVEEAIAAGITNIVLVNHAQKTAIDNYFDTNNELDAQLRQKGKADQADALDFLPKGVRIVSVRQAKPLGLGHAVLQAKAVVGDRPFAVLLPDVILNPYDADYATRNLAFMAQRFAQTGRSQILVGAIDLDQSHKYGVVRLDGSVADACRFQKSDRNQSFLAKGFVEKPDRLDAPSNLAVIGRYVLDSAVFEVLEKTAPSVGGEIQLTDAIDALIATKGVDAVTMAGDSFDAGDKTSYMQAFVYFAKQLGVTTP